MVSTHMYNRMRARCDSVANELSSFLRKSKHMHFVSLKKCNSVGFAVLDFSVLTAEAAAGGG